MPGKYGRIERRRALSMFEDGIRELMLFIWSSLDKSELDEVVHAGDFVLGVARVIKLDI